MRALTGTYDPASGFTSGLPGRTAEDPRIDSDDPTAPAIHYDKRSRTLTITPDVLGERPLYVARIAGGRALLATSITEILETGQVERAADDAVIVHYLRTGRTDELAGTFFRGIEPIRAGETVTLTPDGMSRGRLAESSGTGSSGPVSSGSVSSSTGGSATPRGTAAVRSDASTPHAVVTPSVPSADQLKLDLVEFVRAQEEPVPTAEAYVQFHLMRQAAREDDLYVDDEGAPLRRMTRSPIGTVKSAAFSVLATVRGLGATEDPRYVRSVPGVDPSLADAIVRGPAATATPASLRHRAKSAAHFGLTVRSPFLTPPTDAELVGREYPVPQSYRTAGFDETQDVWFRRLKGTVLSVFKTPQFGARPWLDQRAVLDGFDGWIRRTRIGSTDPFWRLLNLELWAREFLDPYAEGADITARDFAGFGSAGENAETDFGASAQPIPKAMLDANPGKQLDLTLPDGTVARRYPIQTGKFDATSELDTGIVTPVVAFFEALAASDDESHRDATAGRDWNLTVSEKIIAIMQGRSFFTWDVHPGAAARMLSKFVARTPAGIGLGDPVTMQLAIGEAGLARVLFAAAGGAVGKLIGKKGLFYRLVGNDIRAIDGPTEYSVYPSNVSAKLAPKDPDKVARRLAELVVTAVPEQYRATFQGVVVMDANDIGRNALGAYAPKSLAHYEDQFADNPLGQGSEHTPLAVVFER